MKHIDRLHLEILFTGLRMLRDLLLQKFNKVVLQHLATLMKCIGVEALQLGTVKNS